MTIMEQISNHLQFLGYEVTSDDKITRATHSANFNFLMKTFIGGVLLTAYLGGNKFAKNKRNRQTYLEFLNAMNRTANVTRFYADDDSDLVMEAVFSGDYNKAVFGEFIEQWNLDTQARLLQSGGSEFLE